MNKTIRSQSKEKQNIRGIRTRHRDAFMSRAESCEDPLTKENSGKLHFGNC